MVWQKMVMFCPSGTTADGEMRMLVFLGAAGPQEDSFSRESRAPAAVRDNLLF